MVYSERFVFWIVVVLFNGFEFTGFFTHVFCGCCARFFFIEILFPFDVISKRMVFGRNAAGGEEYRQKKQCELGFCVHDSGLFGQIYGVLLVA